MGFDLPVTLEYIARAVVLRDNVAVDQDLAGVTLIAPSDDRVHVLETDQCVSFWGGEAAWRIDNRCGTLADLLC